jgi:hypothetical protein
MGGSVNDTRPQTVQAVIDGFPRFGEGGLVRLVPTTIEQRRAASGASVPSITIHAPITIHAAPGMNERDIARLVRDELGDVARRTDAILKMGGHG